MSLPRAGSARDHIGAVLPPVLLNLLVEINDLKRITSAGREGSIAMRLFRSAWLALAAGQDSGVVSSHATRKALVAARLGDLDAEMLVASGLSRLEARRIEQGAIDAVVGSLDLFVGHFDSFEIKQIAHTQCPAFVAALEQQPRAGITCPGKPRILLEPPENHAEHCLMVAVYGVLLSRAYGADPSTVFLASLAHHLHNASMPDAGFTGETLLGDRLQTVMDFHTAESLRQLPEALRIQVENARRVLPDAATPEGRAFHAADVLDRVVQLNQYARAAELTPQRMLGEMELVHAGPVKSFHDDVLRQVGLL